MGPESVACDIPSAANTPQETYWQFLDAIKRPDLKNILTPQNPWALFTTEVYMEKRGLPGTGGLGILMADIIYQAKKLGLPLVSYSLLYPSRISQNLGWGFWQNEEWIVKSPDELGFKKAADVNIRANSHEVEIELYKADDLPIYAFYEPCLGEVYAGANDSDHRLYQESLLGFGSRADLLRRKISPSLFHINEASSCLVSVAQMDQTCAGGASLGGSLSMTQEKSLLTNHTLVQAAIASASRDQIEHYIVPNLQSKKVEEWLKSFIDCKDNCCSRSPLSTTLAGKASGVSKLHAGIASGQFLRLDGTPVDFYPITNGIYMERWVNPELFEIYQQEGVIDKFDLPTENYLPRIKSLDSNELKVVKEESRQELKDYLRFRKDQYGNSVNIPKTAKVACMAKRIADYKRPGMFLENPERLKEILTKEDIHIVISGKVHREDKPMKEELQRILHVVNGDEVLKERVHFIQNYDEDLAKALVCGVDIWFNTPEVGKEACGTSWEKALTNLAVLVSTEDGGVADIKPAAYLKIEGKDYKEELDSFYAQFKKAGEIINGNTSAWGEFVKRQLAAYINIISGSRMIRDYLNFAFPLRLVS